MIKNPKNYCKDCKNWLPYAEQPDIGVCNKRQAEQDEKIYKRLRFQRETCKEFKLGVKRKLYRIMGSEVETDDEKLLC